MFPKFNSLLALPTLIATFASFDLQAWVVVQVVQIRNFIIKRANVKTCKIPSVVVYVCFFKYACSIKWQYLYGAKNRLKHIRWRVQLFTVINIYSNVKT